MDGKDGVVVLIIAGNWDCKMDMSEESHGHG